MPKVRCVTKKSTSRSWKSLSPISGRQVGDPSSGSITNISYQQGTLESLSLNPESFDAVLGLNILHLLPNVDETIKRVHQLLKPGGIFVSSSALMRDVALHWRMLIPVMQLIGLAPQIAHFNKDELIGKLTQNGFAIDHEWQPAKASLFVIARKNGN